MYHSNSSAAHPFPRLRSHVLGAVVHIVVSRDAVLDDGAGQKVDHIATVDSAPHTDRDCLTAISVSTKLIWLFMVIWLTSDQPESTERM